MTSNNCWPLRLPQRLFGGVAMTRVAYHSTALGPVGWLARRGRRGAIPLELGRLASEVQWVLDHAEAWLRIDEDGRRHLDDRVLVAHPYRFDEKERTVLVAAARAFGFVWTAAPPGASWYAPNAWLIVAHPPHILPIPAPGELPAEGDRRRLERRPLRPGEFVTEIEAEQRSLERRDAKRRYNRERYEAKKGRPMTLGAILADPERARAEIRRRGRE